MSRRDHGHVPVLLREMLEVLAPQPGQTIVDCTLGLGGHSIALAERVRPGGRVIAIDLDPANISAAEARIAEGRGRVDVFQGNFAGIEGVVQRAGVEGGRVHAVLADVGVASTQIDDPGRGFSYRRAGPLDMRMDPSRGHTAADILRAIDEEELAEALLELGDETDAPKIARLITARRKIAPITTTEGLMEIVCEARDFTVERAAGAKLHPAARTFQALRILVNREMSNLERLLSALPNVLRPGGVAAIISFHSGEDRRVKQTFRDCLRAGIYAEVSREPIIADELEERRNPRARSAKLRWARMAV